MADEAQPIIVKKIVKGGHGHHGGAWKIAYADFVTAMMAFFLLLWLLNSVTQESLEGISNYFAPVSAAPAPSGSGGVAGGKTITEEGAAISATARDAVTVDLPPPRAGTGGDLSEGEQESKAAEDEDVEPSPQKTPEELDEEAAQEALAKKEEEQFEDAKAQIEQALAGVPNLKQFRDSLLIENTPEGLRIQLVDRDGLAMFPSGSADMFIHAQKLLEVVSKVILQTPQEISISGHTDATPFVTSSGYGNWELSADRANAARQQLQRFGVPEDRLSRVVGRADKEPLRKEDPKHPSNRRLSIVLLRGTGKEAEAAKKAAIEAREARKLAREKASEALPGLTEIQREQKKNSAGQDASLPLPAINLEINQDIQSQ